MQFPWSGYDIIKQCDNSAEWSAAHQTSRTLQPFECYTPPSGWPVTCRDSPLGTPLGIVQCLLHNPCQPCFCSLWIFLFVSVGYVGLLDRLAQNHLHILQTPLKATCSNICIEVAAYSFAAMKWVKLWNKMLIGILASTYSNIRHFNWVQFRYLPKVTK